MWFFLLLGPILFLLMDIIWFVALPSGIISIINYITRLKK